MDSECLSTTNGRTLALLRRDVCGTYAFAPYTGTRKRTTFSTSHSIAPPKRSLFFVSHRKTYPGRDHFSAVRVGAYGIRPTKWPRRGQECASVIDHLDHSPHKWVAGRAYAIRPYTGTRKRTAVYAYHNRETIKRTTVHAFHRTECPDRDAVEACTDVGWGERKNSLPRYVRKVLTAS